MRVGEQTTTSPLFVAFYAFFMKKAFRCSVVIESLFIKIGFCL